MSAARLATIARFFLKYRNAGVFSGVPLDDPLFASVADADAATGAPEDFARDLAALGPTFVKLGQSLSTRPDFVPAPYLTALESMQDAISPLDAATIRATIEAELGVRVSKMFTHFDDEPLGSASLAQVHAATLRDGREVAVKVQRPDIAAPLREDLDLLERIAGTMGRVSEAGRRYGFAEWVQEFRKTVTAELDYRREGENLEIFARHLEAYPRLFVPQPVWDLSCARVLTMERVRGEKVTRISPLRRLAAPLDALAGDLVRAYLDQVFVHGLIHADPHPGNVILAQDGRLALLDLGMVAHVPPRLRDQLLKLVLAIVDGRGEQAAETFIHLSTRLENYDEGAFSRDTARLIAQYCSAPGATASEGRLLLELTRLGAESGLRPAPELPLLGKTLLNLESVARALDPDIDFRRVIEPHLQQAMRGQVKQMFSPHRLASDALEMQELLRESPRRLSQLLRTLSDNRFRIRVTGLEEARLIESMQKIANRITGGVIAAALILGAALLMQVETQTRLLGYPALALVLFLAAFLLGMFLLGSMWLTDRKVRPTEDRDPL